MTLTNSSSSRRGDDDEERQQLHPTLPPPPMQASDEGRDTLHESDANIYMEPEPVVKEPPGRDLVPRGCRSLLCVIAASFFSFFFCCCLGAAAHCYAIRAEGARGRKDFTSARRWAHRAVWLAGAAFCCGVVILGVVLGLYFSGLLLTWWHHLNSQLAGHDTGQ